MAGGGQLALDILRRARPVPAPDRGRAPLEAPGESPEEAGALLRSVALTDTLTGSLGRETAFVELGDLPRVAADLFNELRWADRAQVVGIESPLYPDRYFYLPNVGGNTAGASRADQGFWRGARSGKASFDRGNRG